MQKRDYFERMVERIAAAIAKIAGHTRDLELDAAESELDAAWAAGIGFRRADAERLDDATLKLLLGPKATLAASLLDAESAIARAQKDLTRTARLAARATSLRL
jgi:hypothetical protein